MKEKLAIQIQNKVIDAFIARRKELGLSHEKLAALAGLHRTAISHIENRRRNPTFLVCLKLSAALDCRLSELLAKTGK
ncbi:MAG: helix-turn-helix transcriptional regulator [Alphaproteobacteria bacterium]|nr:helix-turn-helix transcriptional regulator [Alphaproteobacteria bacterium]